MVLTPLTAALWLVFIAFALVALIARVRGRVRLGLAVRQPAPWRALLAGTGIGVLAIALVFAVELASSIASVSSVRLDPPLLGQAFTFMVPWAIFEEVALRCLLLVGVLVLTRRPWIAIAVNAVVFGLAHAPNPEATALSIASATLGGVMYALAFLRTGRIWLPLSLHLAWNATQATLGFPVSGDTDYSTLLVTAAHDGPWWVTGGSYGPEGGLLGIAARLVVIALILVVTRGHAPAALLTRRPRRLARGDSAPDRGDALVQPSYEGLSRIRQ